MFARSATHNMGRNTWNRQQPFFGANGFDVVDVGDAHITIAAPSKPRKKFGMWITKETDDLYQLLAGRIEAQPDSLPRLVNFEEDDGREFDEPTFRPSLEIEGPITRLRTWLQDLMEQKQVELRQTREHPTKTRSIMVCNSEIAIIQRVQDKIQELLEQ